MTESIEELALKGLKQSLLEHRLDVAEHFLLALECMTNDPDDRELRFKAYNEVISASYNW